MPPTMPPSCWAPGEARPTATALLVASAPCVLGFLVTSARFCKNCLRVQMPFHRTGCTQFFPSKASLALLALGIIKNKAVSGELANSIPTPLRPLQHGDAATSFSRGDNFQRMKEAVC